MSDMLWNHWDQDETLAERLDLVSGRIREIETENGRYASYFRWAAGLLRQVLRIHEMNQAGALPQRSPEECRSDQKALFSHLEPQHYAESYANPAYAVSVFGREAGELFAFLTSELEGAVSCAFQGQTAVLTCLMELFVQIYSCMQEDDLAEAKRTVYWFFHDYCEILVENQIRGVIHAEETNAVRILKEADLTDLRYLYLYGAYIGENELGIAAFLNEMPEEQVQTMADTYTEGYRIGFEVMRKDLSRKQTVQLHYPIGFERMIRLAVKNFERLGLSVTVANQGVTSLQGKGNRSRNAYAVPVNRQYDFDHREDMAFYLDKALVERVLEVMRTVYEQHKDEARGQAGPAVVEVFGEEPFAPESKEEALRFSEKQQPLVVYKASESGQITNQYIPGEERSFTIIAYPIPEIGADFKSIFRETVRINTLDYRTYRVIQQRLIDVLDGAQEVHITGRGANRTDLTVAICRLEDPSRQTAFENCVADVNIPVGEVFTSPVLTGTNGTLHVTEVFLNGLQYKNLEITFRNGMTEACTCSNFDSEAENQKYVRDNVLMHHAALPMGEFAIGTNTTAYRMAQQYRIADRLPILIAEKTGPHFAVGDTCYSHEEDTTLYNPDGKEIVAKENEVSALRREDPSRAYFNCHTDITIPYGELGAVTAIYPDGSSAELIREGLFCVPGTEELNEPLLHMTNQDRAHRG